MYFAHHNFVHAHLLKFSYKLLHFICKNAFCADWAKTNYQYASWAVFIFANNSFNG